MNKRSQYEEKAKWFSFARFNKNFSMVYVEMSQIHIYIYVTCFYKDFFNTSEVYLKVSPVSKKLTEK